MKKNFLKHLRDKGISPKQKNKDPKIPDVAKALGVDTIPLFEMMRKLKIKI